MAKIINLTEASSVSTNDYVVVDDGNSTRKFKVSELLNVIEAIKVNGTDLVVTNKSVDINMPVTAFANRGDPPNRYIVLTLSDGSTINVPIMNDSTIKPYNLPDATDSVKGAVIVDSSMSDSSTNTVQNKIVKEYIDDAIDGKYAIAG